MLMAQSKHSKELTRQYYDKFKNWKPAKSVYEMQEGVEELLEIT